MRYWLSFDLGLSGNYEGLYEWLDNKQAKECGDSVATFTTDLSPQKIKQELKKLTAGQTRARFYIIFRLDGKLHGEFILGGRKRAPWSGYAVVDTSDVEEA
ncbi:MAG TPA: hypothetical protein VFJ58_23270 [Armatimonadota bacterium]|nr:hypothetical protein [Armatimonadota bacterium]